MYGMVGGPSHGHTKARKKHRQQQQQQQQQQPLALACSSSAPGGGGGVHQDPYHQHLDGATSPVADFSGEGADGGEGDAPPKEPRTLRGLYRRFMSFMKQTLTGVKFKNDVELEEMEMSPRYRPGSINYLCQKTRFSENEIKILYRGFKAECPSGIAKEETFKQIYSQFFPPEANAGQYAHYLFRTLDNIGSKNGLVSFEDFVMSLSTLCRGSTEEKIRWLFILYDQDGDGKISRAELANMVVAVYGLMANHANPPIDDESLLAKVDQIFQTLDQNKDGVITTDEFLVFCCSDERFLASISMLDDII